MLNSLNIPESERYKMYHEYMREILQMSDDEYSEKDTDKAFCFYLDRTFIEWIDIYFGTRLVGFIIIGSYPECHPDADRFIIQAYVQPEYRRRGLASDVVSEYIRNNPGTYVMDILKANEPARKFWFETFYKNGYESIVLRPVEHGLGMDAKMYAWKPSTGNGSICHG